MSYNTQEMREIRVKENRPDRSYRDTRFIERVRFKDIR